MKITGFKCWVEGIWNVNLVPRNLRHIWEFSFGKFSGFFSTSFQQQQQQRGWGRGFPQPDSPRCPMASPPSNEYQWNKSTISKSFVCPSTRRRHFGIWASTTRIDFKWIIIKPMKNELNLAGEGRKDEEGAALPALIEHRRLSNDDLQGRRAGGGARPKSQASDGYPGRHVIKCRLVIGSEKRRACWQQLPNFLSVSLILFLLLCESLFHFRVFFSRILPDSLACLASPSLPVLLLIFCFSAFLFRIFLPFFFLFLSLSFRFSRFLIDWLICIDWLGLLEMLAHWEGCFLLIGPPRSLWCEMLPPDGRFHSPLKRGGCFLETGALSVSRNFSIGYSTFNKMAEDSSDPREINGISMTATT